MSLVRVAVPVPALGLLTYRVPGDAAAPSVGARVVVPVGRRVVTGVVVENTGTTDGLAAEDIKPLQEVLDNEPFLSPDLIALARWTAEYYAAGPGETILAVLPPKTRGARVDAHKIRRTALITAEGRLAIAEAKGRQRQALEMLAAAPSGASATELAARGVSWGAVTRLKARGFVTVAQVRVERDPFETASTASLASDFERQLTSEQSTAFARLQGLAQHGVFRTALLHGVTGSGKTEIYVCLSAATLASGRTVLMLVPEIALTPAVASRFRQAFGDRVAVQHSGLSDGERHDQWQRIRRGAVDVVIGTRSAVFAPLDRLGLVIVDEEHDASYKQEESPRYHARDVAIVRAKRAGALALLGSATPSMESYYHAMSGKYERVVLERRVLDRPLAAVTVVDMREEYATRGPDVVLSAALEDGIERRLTAGEQAIVLLNRRGFATSVFCRQCAGTLDCPNCSVSLVVHGAGAAAGARCHYCNYTMRMPSKCALCAAPYLEQAGFGTERIEAEVRRGWPGARVERLDRDIVRRKGAVSALLARFQRGDVDVLVGTQMIAKGHDFARVTLVGVVSADVGLGVADFRASERTFQLLTQVVGRAGRGERPGEAIVQTLYPSHYSIQLACRQNYGAFYEHELKFRRAMRYPPFLSMINVVVRSGTLAGAMADAADIVQRLRAASNQRSEFIVLGPAPAPLTRLRGQYRAQFFAKGTNRRMMRETVMRAIAAHPEIARRTTIDIDPVNLI